MSLVIRDVEVEGRAGLDVLVEEGRIAAIGEGLRARDELDGRGGALIPGLADHHVHLFGLAAKAASVDLAGARGAAEVAARIAAAAAGRAEGGWIRAVGYHESIAGELTLERLDALAPRHRLRVQHQTGSLWMLNSLGVAAVSGPDDPPGVERDAARWPTGRVWREDAWLRARIGPEWPSLEPVGRAFAAFGVTAMTDATVTTDAEAAGRLAQAVRDGALPQRLMLMSGGPLEAPDDGAFTVGPLKVVLDEHDLPEFDELTRRIVLARSLGRAVAVHCVTAGELAVALAAFAAEGSRPGDRIEHAGVAPPDAIAELRSLGLTVVTQPAFICERGDRYAAEIPEGEHDDLYRCATLQAAGVPVAGSSDAPYGSPDPWAAMAAAVERRSRAGRLLGAAERVGPEEALALYLDDPSQPGRRRRRVAVGEPADLCLLKTPLAEALEALSSELVQATLLGGRLTHLSAQAGT